MIDEAMQYALDFCRNELSEEQVIERGSMVVATLRGRLAEVDDASGMTGFVIGGTLKKLKDGDTWKRLPDVPEWWEFKNFCEERLGKSRAWVYQRMRVWERARKYNMSAEEVSEIGWTVADKILSEAQDPSEAASLLDTFRNSSGREEFFSALNGKEQKKPVEKQKRKRRVVRLLEDEEQFYEEALNLVATKASRTLYENMTEEEALMLIVTDWRQGI